MQNTIGLFAEYERLAMADTELAERRKATEEVAEAAEVAKLERLPDHMLADLLPVARAALLKAADDMTLKAFLGTPEAERSIHGVIATPEEKDAALAASEAELKALIARARSFYPGLTRKQMTRIVGPGTNAPVYQPGLRGKPLHQRRRDRLEGNQ